MTARQEPPSDELIHPLLVSFQVIGSVGGMDGRMGFIVLSPIAGSLVLAIDQSATLVLHRPIVTFLARIKVNDHIG
jgi:hypothetical protein